MDRSPSAGREVFTFGAYELDVTAGQLRRGPESVALRPKCFDLLHFLAAHRGELISKPRLLEALWPDVVVADATLSRTITELRETLGDDPHHPTFIETVPRRGYRFIAALDHAADVEIQSAPFTLLGSNGQFPLAVGEHTIGRAGDVAVPVMTPLASRHHARLVVSVESITIEDLSSRNGTFVNGRRIESTMALRPGDRLKVGGETFVVSSPAFASEATVDDVATT